MTFMSKNKLKITAIWFHDWALQEDNRTSGFDIDKRDKYEQISYRARKVLKHRHNIVIDIDTNDELNFKEKD